MVDLGILPGGTASISGAVNDAGTIAGFANIPGGFYNAFMYTTAGGMVNIGTLGGSNSNANAINNSGTIAGYAYTTGDASVAAFSYTTSGGMVNIGSLGGIYPGSGNADGLSGIPAGGTFADAYGINSSGTIVGNSYNASGNEHAFMYTTAGGMVDLGTLGGSSSYNFGAINSSGTIAGTAFTAGGDQHSYIYTTAGGMVDVGTLPGGAASEAVAINSAGIVVGDGLTSGGQDHAFVYIGGVMVDLNTLLDSSGAGWTLEQAYGINDSNQIVGWGYNSSGQMDAYLLTLDVVPEPSTCAMLVGGLGLLGLAVRRRSS